MPVRHFVTSALPRRAGGQPIGRWKAQLRGARPWPRTKPELLGNPQQAENALYGPSGRDDDGGAAHTARPSYRTHQRPSAGHIYEVEPSEIEHDIWSGTGKPSVEGCHEVGYGGEIELSAQPQQAGR